MQQVRQDPKIEKGGVRSGIRGTSDHEDRPREIQGDDHEQDRDAARHKATVDAASK